MYCPHRVGFRGPCGMQSFHTWHGGFRVRIVIVLYDLYGAVGKAGGFLLGCGIQTPDPT